MSEDTILMTMRCMAWERAKGELLAIETACLLRDGVVGESSRERTDLYIKALKEFISAVDDDGLIE